MGSNGTGSPRNGARKMVQDLGRVAGDHEADELADVVIDPPAFAHCYDDRREIVVQQYQARSLPRDIGAALTHGDTDVGTRQGGCVVHAVAGHGDDLAGGLQGGDDADLLCRIDPGVHMSFHDPALQLLVRQRFQLSPGQNAAIIIQNA